MDDSTELEQTGFLLQRLQELKAWQKQQEEQLLKDQHFQLEQLINNSAETMDNVETDDDTTIDQDLSSLHSEAMPSIQSLPSWASRSSSSLAKDLEDKPIVHDGKTFQELLEEKLNIEEVQNSPEFAVAAQSGSGPNEDGSAKRLPFLRKGSGLAKYGGPKRLANTPKRFKRSTSQTKLGGEENQPRLKSSQSCPNVQDAKKPPVTKKTTLKLNPKPALVSKDQRPAKSSGGKPEDGIYDSVEESFMGKLEKAEKMDSEDLRAFELLEEAAQDSSFCSTSSTVKKLMEKVAMPSPIPKRVESHTSTPKSKRKPSEDANVDDEDILMRDIKAFLETKGAVIQDSQINMDDESEENTLKEDDDYHVESNGIIMDSAPRQVVLNGNWSSEDEDEDENERKKSANSRKSVQFSDEALTFSPPRIPRDGPSHLIWSIFAKEREENQRQSRSQFAVKSTTDKRPRGKSVDRNGSPMSRLARQNRQNEYDFEAALIKAKLTELEKEIEKYQKENAALSSGRRKLGFDRKQLARDVQDFEAQKECEKKKMEEEKKRIKRDRTMLEKAQRERKSNFDQKAQGEIEDLQQKVQKITDELQRKEAKWGPTISKLQDQVKFLEKENQLLHEENHKLKMKNASPKISTHLVDPSSRKLTTTTTKEQIPSDSSTPDSGCSLKKDSVSSVSDQDKQDSKLPQLSFSPAESLDSEMTLVSSSIKTTSTTTLSKEESKTKSTVVSVKKNEAKGTTEKVYSDGSVELVYTNGNRKEISADGKSAKVCYYNGDVKETLASGLVKYFYSQTHTWHLTYPDGKEVLQFQNGQEEIRYPNGTLQISFADGSVKRIDVDGTENINFPDGTKAIITADGERTLILPNGQKEIHTNSCKKREYPDGTVKILYDDGRCETRYTSGRIRIKDGDGKLLQDSINSGGGAAAKSMQIKV